MNALHKVWSRLSSSFAARTVFLCLCCVLLVSGCSPNMDGLIADLGSAKPEVVQRAENQLIARKDEAVAPLQTALTNPSAAVRENACLVLVKIENGEAAGNIARLLSDSAASVRETASKTLSGLGEDAAKAVAANLKDFGASQTYMNEAAKLLTGLSATLGDKATAPLAAMLKDPSAASRLAACKLLLAVKGDKAAGDISALLADQDASVSGFVLNAILQMGDAASILKGLPASLSGNVEAMLVSALKDPSAEVRTDACRALAAIKGSGAAPDIVALLADSDKSVSAEALLELRRLGDAAVESYARQYAANAASESYTSAARDLLGTDVDKNIGTLSTLYQSGDDALKKSVLALFAVIGEPAYQKFADGYLDPNASAGSKGADLQMLQRMDTPAAQWLAAYYGKGASPAEKAERLKLIILVSDFAGSQCNAIAERLFAEKDADTDILGLYGASDAAFKAKIISFLVRAGEDSYKRFIPYADAAKYPKLAGVVPQVYSDIGQDAVRMLLNGPGEETLRDGILRRMNQSLVKKSLFALVDDRSCSDMAVKCILRIGNPAYSKEIIAYAKQNEKNKDNFKKAMDMIDCSKPSDDILQYLAVLRDKTGDASNSAYNKLQSYMDYVPASRYYPALKYTANGRGSGKIGRVVVLDYLFNGAYNDTPKLEVDSDTFTKIPARHILSGKAFGGADNAILVREKIVSIGIWYYVDNPSVLYRGYRIDTDISLIDLKKHQVIFKKTLGEREPYTFDEYNYKGRTVQIAESKYDTEEVVDAIISKYLK